MVRVTGLKTGRAHWTAHPRRRAAHLVDVAQQILGPTFLPRCSQSLKRGLRGLREPTHESVHKGFLAKVLQGTGAIEDLELHANLSMGLCL